jgi:hypothetical protein
MILPRIARHTIGVVAVGARPYIEWFGVLYRYVFRLYWSHRGRHLSRLDIGAHPARYVALTGWSVLIWIVWTPIIQSRQDKNASTKSQNIIAFISRLLFGIVLCAGLLLLEKFSIQLIAGKFHERSYAGPSFHKLLTYI